MNNGRQLLVVNERANWDTGASGDDRPTNVAYGSCVDGAHGSRGSFGFLLAVGCKSCVRPVCAALIAAGLDVIRRSGPYH